LEAKPDNHCNTVGGSSPQRKKADGRCSEKQSLVALVAS